MHGGSSLFRARPSIQPRILSLLGWTTLARVVRGKFLALREED